MTQDTGRTARLLPVVRTNNTNAETLRLICCLRDAFPVAPVVVYDARDGLLDFGDAPSTPLDDATVASWGFGNLPKNWGLLFGDFWYYAALESYPDYDLYMLIEDDVHLSRMAAHRLCESLDGFRGDAAAARLSDDLPDVPRYSRALRDIGRAPHTGCIFPLTVASPRAIRAMRLLRTQAQTQAIAINDEAIFASAAFEADLSGLALEAVLNDQLSPGAFDTNPPHLVEVLEADPDDVKIWHPAIPFRTILERIASGEKNYSKHRLRKVLRTAPHDMKLAILAALAERAG